MALKILAPEHEPFEIAFPADRTLFTAPQAATLIGLTKNHHRLVLLLAARYQIPHEELGGELAIFNRDSVVRMRAALLDYRKAHPWAGSVRKSKSRTKSKTTQVA